MTRRGPVLRPGYRHCAAAAEESDTQKCCLRLRRAARGIGRSRGIDWRALPQGAELRSAGQPRQLSPPEREECKITVQERSRVVGPISELEIFHGRSWQIGRRRAAES